MKKLFTLIAAVLLLGVTSSRATHIVGGEFSVVWVSGNTFHLTLHFYRDCANGQADFDDPATIGIYDKVTNANQQCLSVSLTSRDTLKLGDSCYTPNLCVELGTYETNVVIPNNPNGYYVSYSRCCRNGAVIVNIQNPGGAGETWYTEIPDPALHNSTPVFGGYPKGYMCVNNINIQDFSCTDADNDSLVYSLITPLNGNTTSLNPTDVCPDAGPYPYITWQPPYSAANMIGGPMTINSQTGILTATPGAIGVFVFCVRVEEYRRSDKLKLGEVRRDIQYATLACTAAAAYPDTTICAGNPVQLHATGGTTYHWAPTTGLNNPNIATPIATVSSTTTYTVSVSSGGCVSTATVTVNVNSNINVSITPGGPTTFCQGGSVLLTASGALSYKWSTTATTTSISATTSGTYSVTGNSNGCVGTASIVVTVNPNPTVIITPSGPTTFCQGGTVKLTASGATSYLWSNSATTPAINVNATGTFTVTGTTAGCTGTATTSVTVNPPPKVTITAGGPTTFCQGDSVTLTASGALTYKWNNASTHTSIVSSINQSYYAVGTDANGCTAISNFITVTVNRNPTVTIQPSGPTTFCPGGSVGLCASGASTYTWTPGGSGSCITASQQGLYTVNAVNSNGCKGSASMQVTVAAAPIVTITGQPTTFCAGDSVVLTAHGANTYVWSPNGETTVSITAKTGGSYNVTGSIGTCTGTATPVVVTVNPLPVVTITPNGPTTFCQGGSVTITAATADHYKWNTGQTGTSINVSANGSFYVTGTNSTGCSATSNTIDVVVNPLPVVVATPDGPTTFCQGGSVNINGSGASTYVWNPTNDNTTGINVTSSGSFYTVGTDANGCTGTSNTVTVVVNPLPVVTISPNGPTTFCAGGSVTLTAATADNYEWNNGQTGTSINVTASGSFSVTGTNNTGCSATSNTIDVVVNALPVVTAAPDGPTTFCQGGSVNINGSGASIYVWNPTDEHAGTINVTSSGTFYTVGTDANGCTGTSNMVTVVVNPLPVVNIAPDGPLSFCLGGSVNLNATGAVTYAWNPANETTTSINVSTSGSFYTVGTDANGCTGTSNVLTVVVNNPPVVTITPKGPTTFCAGGSVAIDASGASTYLWSPGSQTGVTLNTSSAGSYYTVGTDVNGCTGTSNTVTVVVNPNPTVSIIPQGPTAICEGGSVDLCASNGTTFSWNYYGDTTQCIKAMNPATYTVTITDDNGCTAVSQPLQVTVQLPPDLIANTIGTITCSTPTATITANNCTGSGVTYSWSGPGGFTSTLQCAPVAVAGTYTVTASNGCVTTQLTSVDINITPPNITTSNEALSCLQTSVQLSANSTTAGATFSWTGPNGFTSPLQNPTVSDSGTYIVTATDPNNGCTNSASAYVRKLPSAVTGTCGDDGPVYPGMYFELTGNPNSTPPYPPDNWDVIYNSKSSADYVTGIISDWTSDADNYFYGGMKDITDIPGWKWRVNSVPDKDDLLHAGVAVYGHLLYFFADRFAVNGNSQMGFWLLKNNVQPQSDGTFSGTHAIGDLLILSDFTNGGAAPIIFPYEWVGSGGSDGPLNALTLAEANSYAVVNSTAVPSPWSYIPKFGPANILPPGSFFEGGIDMACLGGSRLDECFPSFIIETRTSQEPTAELKDFIWGTLVPNPNGPPRHAQPAAASVNNNLPRAYPNPFSSTSTIEFGGTTVNTHITVEVYTLTGEKVATLFDKTAEAGVTYKADFDGSNLAAGVYIYRITGGNKVTNGKLVLMK